MSETFQFYCPACGTPLSLPVAASGQQGPCPRCSQEIMAPDLESGAPARRLSVISDVSNKAMAPPVIRRAAPPELPHSDTEWLSERRTDRRVSLVGAILSCLVIGAGAFFAGHVIGKKSVKPPVGITILTGKGDAKADPDPKPVPENPVKPDVTTAP